MTVTAAIADGTVVCQARRPADEVPCWFLMSSEAWEVPRIEEWRPLPGTRMIGTGRGDLVVIDQGGGQFALWHVGSEREPEPLHHEPTAYHLEVQGDDVLLATPDDVVVLDGVLAGRPPRLHRR